MRRRTLASGILAATAALALTACTDTGQNEIPHEHDTNEGTRS